MVNNYSKIAPEVREDKNKPSKSTLQFLLNYSKSVEVKKTKQEGILVHLN